MKLFREIAPTTDGIGLPPLLNNNNTYYISISTQDIIDKLGITESTNMTIDLFEQLYFDYTEIITKEFYSYNIDPRLLYICKNIFNDICTNNIGLFSLKPGGFAPFDLKFEQIELLIHHGIIPNINDIFVVDIVNGNILPIDTIMLLLQYGFIASNIKNDQYFINVKYFKVIRNYITTFQEIYNILIELSSTSYTYDHVLETIDIDTLVEHLDLISDDETKKLANLFIDISPETLLLFMKHLNSFYTRPDVLQMIFNLMKDKLNNYSFYLFLFQVNNSKQSQRMQQQQKFISSFTLA